MLNVSFSNRWQRYFALTLVGGALAGVTAWAQQESKAPAVLAPNLGAKQIPLPVPTQPRSNQQPPSKFVPAQPMVPGSQVPAGLRSARRDPHLPIPAVTPSLAPKTPAAVPSKTFPGKQPAVTTPVPAQPAPTTSVNSAPAKTPVASDQSRPAVSSAVRGAVQAAPLTPELVRLRDKINETLAIYQRRHQNTRDNTPWEVMHAFVAFNVRTEIRRDGPNGPPVNAIGWILWGQRCNGQPLLTLANNRPRAEIGVGVQGHPGQLTAILAQSRVSIDTPVKIQGRDFTLRDLLEEERLGCRPNTELTFRLIALSHYYDLDETWTASDGQVWSIPRLIQEELKQPIRGAACGGTHRLFGLTYAYQQRLKRGQPLDGEYARAKTYIENYQKYAWSLMNPDGTFSTSWFNKAENRSDVDRKIQTTGHVMEWLILAQSDAELRSPRMMRAMDYLATHLKSNPQHDWKLGPMGHALHALMMYNERVFNAVKVPPEFVASRVKLPAKSTLPETPPSQTTRQEPKLPQTPNKATSPLPLHAPEAPSLVPAQSKPMPQPDLSNPFEDEPEVQVPVPSDVPDQGPTPENLAPPKKGRSDQGQEDELSSKDMPFLIQPANAVEPETKEPIKLP